MGIISVVSAILSGIGAGIAIWQACKARKYRDEILQDRKKILLIDLTGIIQEAKKECLKIATPVNKPARGVDQQHVINTIRNCLDKIKNNTHKFRYSSIGKIISSTEGLVNDYVNEKDGAKRSAIADRMLSSMGNISSIISQEIDREI
jgi:hypothetical protein